MVGDTINEMVEMAVSVLAHLRYMFSAIVEISQTATSVVTKAIGIPWKVTVLLGC